VKTAAATIALLGGALSLAGGAAGSLCLGTDVNKPSLRVNSAGFAEVGWTTVGGIRRYAVITPRGRIVPRTRLRGVDVATRTDAMHLPFARVFKRTPDGSFWALQVWRHREGSPLQLRFSRWRGKPTALTLDATRGQGGEILRGQASFAGRPIYGTSRSRDGTAARLAVLLECFSCSSGGGWAQLAAARLKGPDGSFALRVPLRREGARYRATLVGPNFGWTIAPEARALVRSAR
jgi:hypothetical protein